MSSGLFRPHDISFLISLWIVTGVRVKTGAAYSFGLLLTTTKVLSITNIPQATTQLSTTTNYLTGAQSLLISQHSLRQWASYSQLPAATPYSVAFLRAILVLSSHLLLDLLSCVFSSAFPAKTLFVHLIFTHATCPAHFVLLDISPTMSDEAHKSECFTLCSFPHHLVTSSLLGPGTCLSTTSYKNPQFLFSP